MGWKIIDDSFHKVHYGQVILQFLVNVILDMLSMMLPVNIVAMTTLGTSSNPHVPVFPDWTDQNFILSGYLWGYASTQLVGGNISRKYGFKVPMVIGVMITSLLSISIPNVISHFGSYGLLVCLFLQGVCQGCIKPMTADFISRWVPLSERTSLGTFIYAGRTLGTVIATETTGILAASWYGWPLTFIIFGFFGIAWSLLMILFGYNNPKDHPSISSEELELLQNDQSSNKKKSLPWRQIFGSSAMWAAWMSHVGITLMLRLLTTELPTYLTESLKLNISTSSTFLAILYLITWLMTYPIGRTFDYLINNKILSITASRKICNTFGSWGPSIFLVLLAVGRPHEYVTLVFIALALLSMSTTYSGYMINYNDLSPNYSGIIFGIGGFMASVICATPPLLVQYLVIDETNQNDWAKVFCIVAAITFFINVFYLWKGSGDEQEWNDFEKVDDETTPLQKN